MLFLATLQLDNYIEWDYGQDVQGLTIINKQYNCSKVDLHISTTKFILALLFKLSCEQGTKNLHLTNDICSKQIKHHQKYIYGISIDLLGM